jgi:uncharacterized protein (TIGR02246 family)
MKRSIALLSTLILMGFASAVWAGPAEEVAQIAGPRVQAFQEGNLDAYMAAYADNAIVQSSLSPFRIEGKEAIRAYLTALFQIYPGRRVFVRQPVTRAYNDDLVIQNNYIVLYATDQKGQVAALSLRSSVTWAKLGGRWQIVDTHTSRLPVAP